tara:strand:+ start:57 stop:287 length:231 start_codon:yes stop_codon:yes gene_type:complete
MKKSKSLGERVSTNFKCGDIVFWKKLGGEKNIGMIYELFLVEMGGREIKKARVASFKDTLHHEVLIMELKLVSKAK